MIEPDTVKLLRECDAGIKMGISSIDDVIGRVRSEKLCRRLTSCKNEHQILGVELRKELERFNDRGKEPNPIAKTMSQMKTGAKLMMKDSDQTIASLMTDGCNMGVKSLNRYLNEYQAADERAKDAAKKLIHMEQTLAEDLRSYL